MSLIIVTKGTLILDTDISYHWGTYLIQFRCPLLQSLQTLKLCNSRWRAAVNQSVCWEFSNQWLTMPSRLKYSGCQLRLEPSLKCWNSTATLMSVWLNSAAISVARSQACLFGSTFDDQQEECLLLIRSILDAGLSMSRIMVYYQATEAIVKSL